MKRNWHRSLRLPNFDYSSEGAYFVTICTHERHCIFAEVKAGEMQPRVYGEIAEECIQALFRRNSGPRLDEYVIMPNHIHLIIVIEHEDGDKSSAAPSLLMTLVRSLKSCITRRVNQIRKTPGERVLQPDYYEHVIRNEGDLNSIREYIINNPAKWSEDKENPESPKSPFRE